MIIKGWCCHSRRRSEWQHHASTFFSPFLATASPALWFGRSTPPPARPRRLPAALSRCRLLARALAARLPAPPASVRLLPAGLLLACPSAGPAPCPAPPPCRSSPALLPGVRSRLAIAHVTQGCPPHLGCIVGAGWLGKIGLQGTSGKCRALWPNFRARGPKLVLAALWVVGGAGRVAGWVGSLGGLGGRGSGWGGLPAQRPVCCLDSRRYSGVAAAVLYPLQPIGGFSPCAISTAPGVYPARDRWGCQALVKLRSATLPPLTPLHPGEGSSGESGDSPRGSCSVNARSMRGPGGCLGMRSEACIIILPGGARSIGAQQHRPAHRLHGLMEFGHAGDGLDDVVVVDAVGMVAGPMGPLGPR